MCCTAIWITGRSRCSAAWATPFLTTLHGRLDLPELQPIYRMLRRRAAGVDLRRAAPAAAGREFHRHGASRPAGRPAAAAAGAAGLPGVPRPHLPGEMPRPRDRDRTAHRHAAEDGGQGRSGGRRVSRNAHPAADRWQAGRAYRRDRRRGKGRFPQWRAGLAAADRLAGAVRPGDDRGDGLRHAGDRVQRRLGARRSSRTASPASWSATWRRRARR